MRVVFHVDMDAFFASVEQRDKPRLRGKPVVVGSSPEEGRGRGVVSTANYLAREYGIKSALPISKAWEFSQSAVKLGKPEAIFMEPDISRYSEVSSEIMEYLSSMGDNFQVTSIDEAYLEFLNLKTWEEAEKKANQIRMYVKKNFKLTCSVGVGANKLLAKIASNENKPDGVTVVRDSEVTAFLMGKSVRVIPGIGPKAQYLLERKNIRKISELQNLSLKQTKELFGKRGDWLFMASRGMDDRRIELGGEAKSIGHHSTFKKDTLDGEVLFLRVKEMAVDIAYELERKKIFARAVVITVRFSNFKTFTRSHTLDISTRDVKVLESEGLKLLLPFMDSRLNPRRLKIRLVGLRVEKFSDIKQEKKTQKKLF